jgi:long-chain acyl-CoA synthetase
VLDTSAVSRDDTAMIEGAKTAVELFAKRVAASGSKTAMRYKEGGVWREKTWSDWDTASREIAGGLRALGIGHGDRVCLLANTRPEWVESDVGILLAGGVTVPIYQSNTPRECEYIITDCKAKVVIAEDPHQLEKLLHPEVRPRLGEVVKVVLFSDEAVLEKPDHKKRSRIGLDEVLPAGHADRGWVVSLADLRKSGREWLGKNQLDGEQLVAPEDIFTIVYTSGTTGPPKGVVLTHENVVFEVTSVLSSMNVIGEDDEQLIFLPLAHIFAKLLEWTAIGSGSRMAFAESIPKLIENMKEVKPTFMGAVPRVYEKAYTKIKTGLEEKRKKGLSKIIIDVALAAGKKRSEADLAGKKLAGLDALAWTLADRAVFSKIKETFGGRLKFFISGGAPLAREIAEFFHAAGILILEGYGLTETTAATHLNRPDRFRFGSVGPALPGVEVKIADDGEVLMRGKNILREYFGKPDATREALDPDGWFHSGDIGVIEDGLLRITDRKKDIIVTAGGKNVAPQNIEGALKAQCPYVSQVMVHGDKRQFLSALVTLNEETAGAWAKAQGITYTDLADLAKKPEVQKVIGEAMAKLNEGLASYETIKKWKILPTDLTQEAGELTPTLKVKRKFVSEKYRSVLDGFYTGDL